MRAQLCPTLWDPMGCSPPGSSVHGIIQQEYWSRLPFPSSEDLPDPGIKPASPSLKVDSLLLSHWGSLMMVGMGKRWVNVELWGMFRQS